MSFATQLQLFLILSGLLFLPGSALMILSGIWQRWPGMQRLSLAVGLSIAFYPILFYATRTFFPQVELGRSVMITLLAVALAITLWGGWRYRLFHLRLDRLEWLLLVIVALTMVSRMWFAHAHPFPAWTDSLHHTLLTELTADRGRLPFSLDPYFPNVLGMYHLGLYAISGTVQSLSQVPAHTALLWTAQFLNGLCGVGIYLLLDRRVGRTGAVVGAAVAGLFSFHPGLWANWGRFTQLSSIVILPFAWLLAMEVIWPASPSEENKVNARRPIWLIVFAMTTGAAVFFFHFRVGVFYILLLGTIVLFALWNSRSRSERLRTLGVSLIVICGFVLIILPTLWDAAAVYLGRNLSSGTPLSDVEKQQLLDEYYIIPLSSIPYLVAPVWLLLVSGLASLVGLFTRNILSAISLLWVVLLIITGYLYLLETPVLNFTNLSTVLFMLYLPISVVIGSGIEEGLRQLPQYFVKPITGLIVVGLLAVSLPATVFRATRVEQFRHFVTEEDMAAMRWIDKNVPQDATFAINIDIWLPNFAHGTDAGYWIPYLTGRDIVTTSMLADGLPEDYWELQVARSKAAEALESDLSAIDRLRELDVEYIYIGAVGDFSGPGLSEEFLAQSDSVEVLYSQGGTTVLHILPPNRL